MIVIVYILATYLANICFSQSVLFLWAHQLCIQLDSVECIRYSMLFAFLNLCYFSGLISCASNLTQ